jgi:hypothetical protein
VTSIAGRRQGHHEQTVAAALEVLKSLDGEAANVMILVGFDDDAPLVYHSPGSLGMLGLLGLLRAAEHVCLTTETEELPTKEGS